VVMIASRRLREKVAIISGARNARTHTFLFLFAVRKFPAL
jgi:hypothetical protein